MSSRLSSSRSCLVYYNEICGLPFPQKCFHFFTQTILPNHPCLCSEDLTSDWIAIHRWKNHYGEVNYDFLKEQFGSVNIKPSCCSADDCFSEDSQALSIEVLDHYLDMCKRCEKLLGSKQSQPPLYAKDLHLVKHSPDPFYSVPVFFSSDWLNEYWDSKKDSVEEDYRFVYIGMRGTWTPRHVDVFHSYSWSANICGIKKWYLVPPGYEELLPADLRNCTEEEINNSHMIVLFQFPGEVIFVPSNWYHQVHNLSECTISINHNWVNAFNVCHMVEFIISSAQAVRIEIADCQKLMEPNEWERQCELVLKVDSGIDLKELETFLTFVLDRRRQEASLLKMTETERTKVESLIQCESCLSLVTASCKRQKACLESFQKKIEAFIARDCGCTSRNFCQECRKILVIIDTVTCNHFLEQLKSFSS